MKDAIDAERGGSLSDNSFSSSDSNSEALSSILNVFLDGFVFLFFGLNESEPTLNEFPYAINEGYMDDGKYTFMGYKNTSLETNIHFFSEGWQVNGGVLETIFHFSPSFSLEGNYLFMYEQVVEGKVEKLHWTAFNLSYHRVRSEVVDGWWGMGVSHLVIDEGHTSLMLNMGVDVFPFKPVSFGVQGHWSWIDTLPLSNIQIKVKYHYDKGAVYTGYQRFAFAKVPIHSWMLGLGLYI